MNKAAIVSRWVEGFSGATTYILEHCRRLSERGWSVDVFGERLDEAAIRGAGATPQRLRGWPWGSYLKRRYFARVAGRAVSRRGYDVVHGHGDSLEQDILSLHNCVHAAHEAIHGAPLPSGSGVGRMHERILRGGCYGVLIANSRLMKEEIERRFGVPAGKVRVVYPGFDPARFHSVEDLHGEGTRNELGLVPGDILFGLITSGDFKKRGVFEFLGALGRLKSDGRIKAIVVGKENHIDDFRRRASGLGLESRIRFLPPAAAVERYYHALDAYVLPAHYEEFGMSVQEAMACGLPVITGARVGAAELIAGEGRGFILEKIKEEALAEMLKTLAASSELRARLGAANAQAVQGNGWDRHFEQVWDCYQAVRKKPLSA